MSWLQCSHHGVNYFHLVGVSVSAKQLRGYGSEYSGAHEDELKVPDFVKWLTYYYFVLFDRFSLLPHFHFSL